MSNNFKMSKGIIAKLELKPGDALVLKVNGRLSQEQKVRANEWLKEFLTKAGHGQTEVLVLDGDCSLEVLSKSAA